MFQQRQKVTAPQQESDEDEAPEYINHAEESDNESWDTDFDDDTEYLNSDFHTQQPGQENQHQTQFDNEDEEEEVSDGYMQMKARAPNLQVGFYLI
jgi:hypothetical protein